MLKQDAPMALLVRIAGFLKAREPACVAAAARFLQRDRQDQLWVREKGSRIAGLIMQSRGSLFPVFNGKAPFFLKDFLAQSLQGRDFYAIQGIRKDVELLEQVFAWEGRCSTHSIDYDLMVLDQEPARLRAFIPGLILRYAEPRDEEGLFHLQAAYEQEEVLLKGRVFNPALCRLSLERIMHHEYLLLAQGKPGILGKINTNARSFSRYQIGGVYVLPEYRDLGIASFMAAAFARDLWHTGRGLSLFVKKQNPAARKVYLHVGFKVLEDYRISYYSLHEGAL
jgi:predicted GNAT family acetyltransferase